MRRLVTLLIAASLLALPCSALAQSAGDEQYADPFGQVEKPNNGQGQQSEAPAQAAPAPAAPAQAAAPTTAADTAAASQETGSTTLPRTGVDTVFFLVMGATLLLAGTTIRRLAS